MRHPGGRIPRWGPSCGSWSSCGLWRSAGRLMDGDRDSPCRSPFCRVWGGWARCFGGTCCKRLLTRSSHHGDCDNSCRFGAG
jgi:hypothetical protein